MSDFGEKNSHAVDATDGTTPLFTRLRLMLAGRWRLTMLLVVLFGGGLGFLGWRMGQRVYSSHALLRIAPLADHFALGNHPGPSENYDAFMDTQLQLIHSRRLIDKAMDSAEWKKLNRPYSSLATDRFAENLVLSRKAEVIFVEMHDPDPNAAYLGVKSVIDAYQQLSGEQNAQAGQERLEFLQDNLSRVKGEISRDEDAFHKKFAEMRGYETLAPEELLPLINFDRSRVEDLKNQLQLTSTRQENINALLERLDANWGNAPATAPVTAAGTALPGAAATRISSVPAPPTNGVPNAPTIGSPTISLPTTIPIVGGNLAGGSLSSDDLKASARLEALSLLGQLRLYVPEIALSVQQYEAASQAVSVAGSSESAAYQRALSQLQLLRVTIHAEVVAAINKAQNDAQAYQVSLQTAFETLSQLSRGKDQTRDIIERLEVERGQRNQWQELIDDQERRTRSPARLTVLDPPAGGVDFSDSRPRLAAMLGIVGIVMAIGSMLLVSLAGRRVKTAHDARLLGSARRPILGVLPEIPDDIHDHRQATEVAHYVHNIRTSLQMLYGWIEHPAFAITGATDGTGKSTLTLGLGLSFAANRCRTLLIDLDLAGGGISRRLEAVKRRPLGHLLREEGYIKLAQLREGLQHASASGQMLGEALIGLGHVSHQNLSDALQRQKTDCIGVLDALEGESLGSCVCKTDVRYLSILPLGGAGAHHGASISPESLQNLLDAARAKYDIILIDTGTVPGSLEGSTVVNSVDGVIVTVSRGDSRAGIRRCLGHLASLNARLAGIVFNRARMPKRSSLNGSSLGVGIADAALSAPAGNGKYGPLGQAVVLAAGSRKEDGRGNRDE